MTDASGRVVPAPPEMVPLLLAVNSAAGRLGIALRAVAEGHEDGEAEDGGGGARLVLQVISWSQLDVESPTDVAAFCSVHCPATPPGCILPLRKCSVLNLFGLVARLTG